MSEEPTQIPADAPAPVHTARVELPPPESSGSTSASPGAAQDKPELLAAGAFAGAFLFAKILRRIGRS